MLKGGIADSKKFGEGIQTSLQQKNTPVTIMNITNKTPTIQHEYIHSTILFLIE